MKFLFSFFRRRGVPATGLALLALGAAALCGAGPVPVKDLLPQGTLQGDLDAGGHSLIHVSTVLATNMSVSGSLTPPADFWSTNGVPLLNGTNTFTNVVTAPNFVANAGGSADVAGSSEFRLNREFVVRNMETLEMNYGNTMLMWGGPDNNLSAIRFGNPAASGDYGTQPFTQRLEMGATGFASVGFTAPYGGNFFWEASDFTGYEGSGSAPTRGYIWMQNGYEPDGTTLDQTYRMYIAGGSTVGAVPGDWIVFQPTVTHGGASLAGVPHQITAYANPDWHGQVQIGTGTPFHLWDGLYVNEGDTSAVPDVWGFTAGYDTGHQVNVLWDPHDNHALLQTDAGQPLFVNANDGNGRVILGGGYLDSTIDDGTSKLQVAGDIKSVKAGGGRVILYNSAAASGSRVWDLISSGGHLSIRAAADDETSAADAIDIFGNAGGIAYASVLSRLVVNSLTDDGVNALQVNGAAKAQHYLGSGTPTIAAGDGAGTSPTVSIAGNDVDGIITVTTGTTPTASATVATVTFANAYAAAPVVVASPHNATTAALSGAASAWSGNETTTTFILTSGTTALAGSTTYTWAYHVLQ